MIRLAALTGIVLALAACSSTPPPPSLAQARGDLSTAISAPPDTYSRPELDQARQKVDQANEAARNDDMTGADRLSQEALADLRLSRSLADAQQAQTAEKQLQATTNTLKTETDRSPPQTLR